MRREGTPIVLDRRKGPFDADIGQKMYLEKDLQGEYVTASGTDLIAGPVLAVDDDGTSLRMLLETPIEGGFRQYAFLLPSPQKVLADAEDAPKGDAPAQADGGMASADIGMPGTNRAELERLFALIALTGLPEPGRLLFCSREPGRDGRADSVDSRSGYFDTLFAREVGRGLSPEAQLREFRERGEQGGAWLQPCAITRISGISTLDGIFAFVLGMLSFPAVAARSRREGVLLLDAGKKYLSAALVYRERVFSILEIPVSRVPDPVDAGMRQEFSRWLDDFRLGWLPPEAVRAMGGFVARAPELPAEAEGFRPTFITGDNAGMLEGYGREPRDGSCGGMVRCQGLLRACPKAE